MNLSNYRAMLDYIETHAPEHPDLERLQSKGMTLINSILISKIHAALLDSVPTVAPAISTAKKEQTQTPDDNIVRSYDTQLRKLFTQRARISNSFHISAGPHEDQQIADQVIDIQKQIAKVMADKAYYLEKKQLPPIEEADDAFYIPTNPFELIAKHKSISTSLIHRKKEQKNIDPKKEPAKYAAKQATIERLTKYKQYLEQERDAASKPTRV